MLEYQRWRIATVTLAAATMLANISIAADMTTGDGLLKVTAAMPEQVRLGEQFSYDVNVTNASDNVTIHDIELQQLEAEGFSVDSTMMDSKDTGGKMKISVLKPGESKTINVKASADKEGDLRSCLAISKYVPAICLTSKVSKPELELTKTAPKTANRCEVIELTYEVKNGGTGNVGKFVVTDKLAKGLATIDGEDTLKFDVDGLEAGKTRKFLARVFAERAGEFTSRAVAKAENSKLENRSAETTTTVDAADLKVSVEGPKRLYGEKLAKFTGHVTNTGSVPAANVVVNVSWPKACNLVDMGDPTMGASNVKSKPADIGGKKPTKAPKKVAGNDDAKAIADNNNMEMSEQSFTIERLDAGQTASFEYAIKTGNVKTLPTKVIARYICDIDEVEDGNKAEREVVAMAMARAEVVRLPALQLVVLDDEDPVAIDSNVVYSIRVWNEGDADDRNVSLTAEIPEGLEFVSAKGPTENSVEGSKVTFKPIETMKAGDEVTYKVTAKSVSGGNVRFAAVLKSDGFKEGVTGEEPTVLFDENADTPTTDAAE